MEGSIEEHVNKFSILNSDSSLSEQDRIGNYIEQQHQKENVAEMEITQHDVNRPTKRRIEGEEDQDWQVVRSKEKRLKSDDIEMYISCSEKMPKLFALAKIFKSYGLTDIDKVKFVNPFKIRVDVNSENCASKLETCQELLDKGWRIHRAMEKNLSFGVIKNVDMDMDDEAISTSITTPENAELLSIYRLKRRCKEEDGWKACESVRLCFKGSFLPGYVTVDGLRIRVDPYVFPVSQCARCWKLGHVTKRCPSNKLICPKCAGDHANCETNHFRCVNCNGKHMAMTKSCPTFVKEKKLREIMAEFNCTYRRALTMYVPPIPPEPERPKEPERYKETEPSSEYLRNLFPEYCQPPVPTTPMFAEVVKTKADVREESKRQPFRRSARKIQRRPSSPFAWAEEPESDGPCDPIVPDTKATPHEEVKTERSAQIQELMKRLKEILFFRGASIQSKVKMAIKCCVECLVFVVVDFIPDWPILQAIYDYFCQDG